MKVKEINVDLISYESGMGSRGGEHEDFCMKCVDGCSSDCNISCAPGCSEKCSNGCYSGFCSAGCSSVCYAPGMNITG